MLDMLEELLSMLEPLGDYLTPEDYQRLREISCQVADLRDPQ